MTRSITRPRYFLLLALALSQVPLAAGCGGGKAVTVVPVRGKVTVNGQPITSGQVSFLPATADQGGAGLTAATISTSGEYQLSTAGKQGAPAGTYKVTVTPSMIPTGGTSMPVTPFNRKFTQASTTPLTVIVPSESYDLKLTP